MNMKDVKYKESDIYSLALDCIRQDNFERFVQYINILDVDINDYFDGMMSTSIVHRRDNFFRYIVSEYKKLDIPISRRGIEYMRKIKYNNISRLWNE